MNVCLLALLTAELHSTGRYFQSTAAGCRESIDTHTVTHGKKGMREKHPPQFRPRLFSFFLKVFDCRCKWGGHRELPELILYVHHFCYPFRYAITLFTVVTQVLINTHTQAPRIIHHHLLHLLFFFFCHVVLLWFVFDCLFFLYFYLKLFFPFPSDLTEKGRRGKQVQKLAIDEWCEKTITVVVFRWDQSWQSQVKVGDNHLRTREERRQRTWGFFFLFIFSLFLLF